MIKWSTTLVLILAFSGNAVAGMPTHSEGNNPAMMSCCKAAKGGDTQQASIARVCCAINCSEPTLTGGIASSISSQLPVAAIHPAAGVPVAGLSHPRMHLGTMRFLSLPQPRYIRNLALLI